MTATSAPEAGPTIAAITLWQPWATLMAIGAKRNETRSWSTTHRGPLAIHAAAKCDLIRIGERLQVGPYEMERDSREGLLLRGPGLAPYRLPLGEVLAVVSLVDVKPTDSLELRPSLLEAALGDYSAGRYAWQTGSRSLISTSMRRLTRCRGRQGLWRWTIPAAVNETLLYPVPDVA